MDNNSGEIHILYNGDLDVSNGEHFLHGRTPIALELLFFFFLLDSFIFFQPVSPHLSSTACMLRQMRALQPLILESTSPSTLTPLSDLGMNMNSNKWQVFTGENRFRFC